MNVQEEEITDSSVVLPFQPCPSGKPAIDTPFTITMPTFCSRGTNEYAPFFIAINASCALAMGAGNFYIGF
jgi:hypothetical protein